MLQLLNSGLDLLFYLGVFAVMIGVLVSVHEYGHFLAARLFGVRVLRFSIGFGPELFGWYDRLRTRFSVAPLPLGGYVLMQNGDEPDAADHPGESYREASLTGRLVICFAGPAANLLLAVVLQAGLVSYGMPGIKPELGQIQPDSAAAAAGFKAGDLVVRVGTRQTPTLADLRLELIQYSSATTADEVEVLVERAEPLRSQVRLQLNLSALADSEPRQDPLQVLGLSAAAGNTPVIGLVSSGSAAERAGLQVQDVILKVDGEPLQTWGDWVQKVRAAPEIPLALTVGRDGGQVSLTLVPEQVTSEGEVIGRAGVALGSEERLQTLRRFPVWQAPWQALVRVADLTVLTGVSIYQLITGQMSLENLSGPVGIAQVSGQAAKISMVAFLNLMSLLSISLGVINLVPLPVLDGGRALLHLIEGAIRKPLPPRLEGMLNLVGVVLVASLMAFTLVQDIGRL